MVVLYLNKSLLLIQTISNSLPNNVMKMARRLMLYDGKFSEDNLGTWQQ